MATDESHDRLIHRLTSLGELGDAELAALRAMPLRVRDYDKGEDIIRQGDRPTESCLIISGLVCRYKFVASGKRQILSLHFTGDMPDLQGLHLE